MSTHPQHLGQLTRRTVLGVGGASAAAVALAACSIDGGQNSGTPGASTKPVDVGQVSKVPVGGNLPSLMGFTPIILTQPTAGTIVGFSAVCTHMGCTVAPSSSGSEFDCPCHGSAFDGASGEVVHGPALLPLRKLAITLQGDTIMAALA